MKSCFGFVLVQEDYLAQSICFGVRSLLLWDSCVLRGKCMTVTQHKSCCSNPLSPHWHEAPAPQALPVAACLPPTPESCISDRAAPRTHTQLPGRKTLQRWDLIFSTDEEIKHGITQSNIPTQARKTRLPFVAFYSINTDAN